MLELFLPYLLCLVFVVPLFKSAMVFIISMFSSGKKSEFIISRFMFPFTYIEFLVSLVGFIMCYNNQIHQNLVFDFGYSLIPNISLIINLQTLFMLLFTQLIFVVVIHFSKFYMHGDPNYSKFFGLIFLFKMSVNILLLTDHLVWFLTGWELLGITSVLLISFYSHRANTIKNALRVFAFYKISDVLLFISFAILVHKTNQYSFLSIQQLPPHYQFQVFALLIFAVMIKIGLLPIPWLPRAMEGPTPSSSIYYASLATHVPLLVLIKTVENYQWPETFLWVMLPVLLGLTVMNSMLASVYPDAKNSQAYATLSQFSLILIELLMGLSLLAFIHTLTHCLYRIAILLKSPSVIYDHHYILGLTGRRSEASKTFLPQKLSKALYYLTLKEFYFIPKVVGLTDRLIFANFAQNKKRLLWVAVLSSVAWIIFAASFTLLVSTSYEEIWVLVLPWTMAILSFVVTRSTQKFILIQLLNILSLFCALIYAEHAISFFRVIEFEVAIFCLALLTISFQFNLFKLPKIKFNSAGIFLLALLIVGLPGPGSFLIFENIFHHLYISNVYVAIAGFTILSLLALSTVRFFYFNSLQEKNYV